MSFDPLLPGPVLAAVAAVAVVAAIVRLRRDATVRRRRPAPGTVRWMAMGVLALLAAIDPTIGGGQVAVKRSDANVLFVVDTTGSMAAEDYEGNEPRLVGARADIVALADEFPGAHFALVTWNSKARVIMPWTVDRGALDSAVRLLHHERTIYAQGSRLDEPLPTMRELIPRSGPRGGYDVVFYLSDGEQTEQPDSQSFGVLADAVAGGAVLGYGTDAGARMRVYTGRDREADQFIHDYATGRDAVSRIDEEHLARIADELGVQYLHRTAPGDVEQIAEAAAAGASTVYAGQRDAPRRLYWVPAFGLVALVLWQLAATGLEVVDSRRAIGRAARGAV